MLAGKPKAGLSFCCSRLSKARRLPYSLLARLFLVPPLCLDWP